MLSELEVRAQLLEIKGKNAEAKQGNTKINIIKVAGALDKVRNQVCPKSGSVRYNGSECGVSQKLAIFKSTVVQNFGFFRIGPKRSKRNKFVLG